MATVDKLMVVQDKDLKQQVFTPAWIVEGVAQRKGLTIVFGESGSGKTWVLVDMAVAVANGEKQWLGLNVTKSRVLILDEESGKDRMSGRIYITKRGHEVDHALPIGYVFKAGINLRNPKSVERVAEAIQEQKPDLVIIDTLANVTPGADENTSRDMLPALLALARLAQEFNCAIVIIHHCNKSGGYRGSSSLKGMCDSMLKAERSEDKATITLECEKGRDGAEQNVAALMNWGDDIFNLSSISYEKKLGDTEVLENRIIEVLLAGEMNTEKLKSAVGVGKDRLLKVCDKMVSSGKITLRNGANRSKNYSIKVPASTEEDSW